MQQQESSKSNPPNNLLNQAEINSSHNRQLLHLAAIDPEKDELHSQISNQEVEYEIPDKIRLIDQEISQTGIFKSDHLKYLIENPLLIENFIRNTAAYHYQMEDEVNMVDFVLSQINDINFGRSFEILLKSFIFNMKKEESHDKIFQVCSQNITIPKYTSIFINLVDRFPSPSVWPIVLTMPTNFEPTAISLLFNNCPPSNKIEVIQKLKGKEIDIELFTLLSCLNLTKEEIENNDICIFTLNIVNSAIENPKGKESRMLHDALVFMSNIVINMNFIPNEFLLVSNKLLNEGAFDQKEETIKFFYATIEIITNDIMDYLIENYLIELAAELLQTGRSSVIESSLGVIMNILERLPDSAILHIDESVVESIRNVFEIGIEKACQMASHLIERIHKLVPLE